MNTTPDTFTAFEGFDRLAAGPLAEVAVAVKHRLAARPDAAILVIDDRQGRVTDLDLRGTDDEIRRRHAADGGEAGAPAADSTSGSARRGRGRPRLGVVSREVTLLPRHWDWLAAQPGGASAALRRLVEEARRSRQSADAARAARDAAYRVMSALGGDLPQFEEAARALFAGDRPGFEARISEWPADLRAYVTALAFGGGPDGRQPEGK